jgi:hypothetical protein
MRRAGFLQEIQRMQFEEVLANPFRLKWSMDGQIGKNNI